MNFIDTSNLLHAALFSRLVEIKRHAVITIFTRRDVIVSSLQVDNLIITNSNTTGEKILQYFMTLFC
ncbi:MAG TPA: hypothetical protein VIM75_06705 [Ohtaekwangia sp.]|uniref:hypothetical protein n=1 Tax=Ohtaekwangia sp. TaxID=2066019 RepID=UPI002F9504C0